MGHSRWKANWAAAINSIERRCVGVEIRPISIDQRRYVLLPHASQQIRRLTTRHRLPVPNADRSSLHEDIISTDLERAMAQMNMDWPESKPSPTTAAGKTNTVGPIYTASSQREADDTVRGPITKTVRDSLTGLETRWEVGASSSFADQYGHRRTLNFKRVRAVGREKAGTSGKGAHSIVFIYQHSTY